MKTLKKIGFSLLCIMLTITLFAQVDSTGTVGTTSGGGIWDWITKNIPIAIAAILAVYEAVVRFVPTIKDWSVVNKIIAALQFVMDKIFPNNAKDSTTGASAGVHENTVVKTSGDSNNTK